MKIILSIVVATLCSANLFANVISDLKKQPASKYELGLVKLELIDYVLNEKLMGQEVAESDFKIKAIKIGAQDDNIIFAALLEGRTKDMSEAKCKQLNTHLKTSVDSGEVIRNAWQGLSAEEYKELEKSVVFATRLIAKENEAFIINCTDQQDDKTKD